MIEIIVFHAVLTALFSFLLDYCLGRPSDNFSPHEVFSWWTIMLAENRFKKMFMWGDFKENRTDALLKATSRSERYEVKHSFDRMLVAKASEYFTWERAVGMCPVCTNVWINIVFVIILNFVLHLGILPSLYIILLSNFLIRLMIKL